VALNIKDENAHRLARELAARRGTSLTQAVADALAEALNRTESTVQPKLERLREISRRAASLPVLDTRAADEILGYDDFGMPS
jgi:antitoxin VapB